MDIVLYYIRDNLVGTHYFIYAFILFFLMFSIIGYLFKQKYAKFDIKLATSQDSAKKDKKSKEKMKNLKNNKVVQQTNSVSDAVKTKINNQTLPETNIQNAEVKQEKEIPRPMPNITPQQVPIPTPMPNKEEPKVNPTPTETVVKPNLSGTIPEIK